MCRRVAIVLTVAAALSAGALPAAAQSAAAKPRAHGAAICVAQGLTCAPARYAQAGDACACKDLFGSLKRGRVAWK